MGLVPLLVFKTVSGVVSLCRPVSVAEVVFGQPLAAMPSSDIYLQGLARTSLAKCLLTARLAEMAYWAAMTEGHGLPRTS